MGQIKIKIMPNGEIQAETIGLKGNKCLKYLEEMEQLTNAVIKDSEFTEEYLQLEPEEQNDEMDEVTIQ